MLINLSNHNSAEWGAEQKQAAVSAWEEIIDIKFPQIMPDTPTENIYALAGEYKTLIMKNLEKYGNGNNAVHIVGEYTFTYALLTLLKEYGIRAVSSTSARETVSLENGQKIVRFSFAMFRDYFI